MPSISIPITPLETIKLYSAETDEIVRTSSNPLRPIEYLHSFQLLSEPNPIPKILRLSPSPLVTHFSRDSQSLSAIGESFLTQEQVLEVALCLVGASPVSATHFVPQFINLLNEK